MIIWTFLKRASSKIDFESDQLVSGIHPIEIWAYCALDLRTAGPDKFEDHGLLLLGPSQLLARPEGFGKSFAVSPAHGSSTSRQQAANPNYLAN